MKKFIFGVLVLAFVLSICKIARLLMFEHLTNYGAGYLAGQFLIAIACATVARFLLRSIMREKQAF